jgi:NADH:ubiquinone oxidoreductase subunit 2 (subunit N)
LISISSINLLFGFLGLLSLTKTYADGAPILVILTVIALISTILGRGYYFRVLKYSLNGLEELPKFNNWEDMLKDGIKLSIVTIIYLIPFTLILISLKASIDPFYLLFYQLSLD